MAEEASETADGSTLARDAPMGRASDAAADSVPEVVSCLMGGGVETGEWSSSLWVVDPRGKGSCAKGGSAVTPGDHSWGAGPTAAASWADPG